MRRRRVNRARLAALFDRHGWDQREFTRQTGLSRTYYYQLRAGQRQPSLETALQMARLLGCSIDDFSDPIYPYVDPERSLRSA
jgi:transcriptional regulator with XRE-family HTH domain